MCTQREFNSTTTCHHHSRLWWHVLGGNTIPPGDTPSGGPCSDHACCWGTTIQSSCCWLYVQYRTVHWVQIQRNDTRYLTILTIVKTVVRDHCYERPPVLKDYTFLGEHIFQYNWTCHQRPPVLTDHIFVANRVVFQDRFHCTHRSPSRFIHWVRPIS